MRRRGRKKQGQGQGKEREIGWGKREFHFFCYTSQFVILVIHKVSLFFPGLFERQRVVDPETHTRTHTLTHPSLSLSLSLLRTCRRNR